MDAWKQMGRAKIPMKWIPKETSRNLTFIKRKKGLRKKIEELSILCGVEACMVCFGPHTSQDRHLCPPDVWPNLSKALEVIDRYRSLPKEEQDKKKLDNSSFLEQRINKLRSELHMRRKESKDLEMGIMYPCWDNSLNDLSVEKLRDLWEYIDVKLEAVQDRITFLTRQENETSHASIVGNDIMDKPLYHPSNSHIMLQNLLLSMPYHSQENLSLTQGYVHPHLSLEEQQYYKNNFGGSSLIDYHSSGEPIVLTDNFLGFGNIYNTNRDKDQIAAMDDRILVENAATHLVTRKSFPFTFDHNYTSHWTPCCTKYCPCPEHVKCNMDSSYGSQDFHASAELQEMVHGLMKGEDIHHGQLISKAMGIDIAQRSPGAGSSTIDEQLKIES